jgi:hypothetical protein
MSSASKVPLKPVVMAPGVTAPVGIAALKPVVVAQQPCVVLKEAEVLASIVLLVVAMVGHQLHVV